MYERIITIRLNSDADDSGLLEAAQQILDDLIAQIEATGSNAEAYPDDVSVEDAVPDDPDCRD